jgi:hypothetical protein
MNIYTKDYLESGSLNRVVSTHTGKCSSVRENMKRFPKLNSSQPAVLTFQRPKTARLLERRATMCNSLKLSFNLRKVIFITKTLQ